VVVRPHAERVAVVAEVQRVVLVAADGYRRSLAHVLGDGAVAGDIEAGRVVADRRVEFGQVVHRLRDDVLVFDRRDG